MDEQAHRVLPVRVDAETVTDMNGPECGPGETVELILGFVEEGQGDAGLSGPADMLVTVDAWAQEYPDAGPVDAARMTWSTLLTGDGWSARWDAPRPVLGRVRLTGRFVRESLGPHETRVVPTRGALARIRTQTGRRGEEPEIAEVDRIRRPASDDSVRCFLVDLDLDAASSPEPEDLQRPCVVHGFAVTGPPEARALWRGDARLPLVWRTDLASGRTTPVALPLRINDAGMYLARVRGPLADRSEDACRVVAVGRSFTVRGDGRIVEDEGVEHRPVSVDGAGQVVPAPGGGRIVSRYEETGSRMYTPPGGIYGWPVSSGVQYLGRAGADGAVTWIREREVGESDTVATLLTAGGQVMLWRHGVVGYLGEDLEVVREARLPEDLPPGAGHSPQVSGDFLVVAGDRVLAVLDPADLSVVLQVEVSGRAHAQVDEDAVWVVDSRSRGGLGDRLRVFTQDAGEWSGREVAV